MANKTYRKLLVNAFENIAQSNKWNDSKHSPVTMKRVGFKNARSWARAFAACYMPDGGLGAMNDFFDQHDRGSGARGSTADTARF